LESVRTRPRRRPAAPLDLPELHRPALQSRARFAQGGGHVIGSALTISPDALYKHGIPPCYTPVATRELDHRTNGQIPAAKWRRCLAGHRTNLRRHRTRRRAGGG
jgi:hypothetical protein